MKSRFFRINYGNTFPALRAFIPRGNSITNQVESISLDQHRAATWTISIFIGMPGDITEIDVIQTLFLSQFPRMFQCFNGGSPFVETEFKRFVSRIILRYVPGRIFSHFLSDSRCYALQAFLIFVHTRYNKRCELNMNSFPPLHSPLHPHSSHLIHAPPATLMQQHSCSRSSRMYYNSPLFSQVQKHEASIQEAKWAR